MGRPDPRRAVVAQAFGDDAFAIDNMGLPDVYIGDRRVMTADEMAALRQASEFHAAKFCLWVDEDFARYRQAMAAIHAGVAMLHHVDRRFVDAEMNWVVLLEWSLMYKTD